MNEIKILITYLTCEKDNNTELFIKSILKSQIKNSFGLYLAISDEITFQTTAQQPGIRYYHINIGSHKNIFTKSWKAIFSLQKIYLETGFQIIHTNTSFDHKIACIWKFFFKPPVHIIRTRYTPEKIKNNFPARLIHNRLTSVNIILDKTTEISLRGNNPDQLRLDNPCVLQDYPDLSKRGLDMLEHCYLSMMTTPSHNQITSGKISDWSHITLSYIIPFYFNQGDAKPLLDLLHQYEGYNPAILDRVHFVIVDDGSPLNFNIPELKINYTWLKINEDIKWNQSGARNLGVIYAKSDNMLLTDMDMLFPEDTLEAIVNAPPCGRYFYKFYLSDHNNGKLSRGHPNIFLMSRARFLRLGGYDEEFCGHYGADDYRFVKFQKAHGSRQRYFDSIHPCIRRSDINRETHYHSLERDLSFNTPVDARKKFEMENFGGSAGHTRMFLNFTWKKVSENYRPVEIKRKINRRWKNLWLLRQIMSAD